MSQDNSSYLLYLFDYNRHGVNHIAKRILIYLDFKSFVAFKQTCATIYTFIVNSKIEDVKLRYKLQRDWRYGEAKEDVIDLKLMANRSKIENTAANNRNIVTFLLNINNGQQILASSYKAIYLHNSKTKVVVREFTNPNENLEQHAVTRFDIALVATEKYLIGGSTNGVLSIWELHTGVLCSSKQLFGIISGVKCKDNVIVTSHFGKAYDIGCISVRIMQSPQHLTVIWSAYQDIMPIFCFDFNDKFICTIEWLGTFDRAHVGSAVVYTRSNPSNRSSLQNSKKCCYERFDLSEEKEALERQKLVQGLIDNLTAATSRRYTCLALVGEDYLALGSDDVQTRAPNLSYLVIWDLINLTCIHSFSGHTQQIIEIEAAGDRIITRDKSGSLIMWDTTLASDNNYVEDEDSLVLMRRLDLDTKDSITSITIDLTHLTIGRPDSITMHSFWNASTLPSSPSSSNRSCSGVEAAAPQKSVSAGLFAYN